MSFPLPQHPDIAHWRAPILDDIDAIHALLAAADAVDHPTWITARSEVADTFEMSTLDHARDSLLGFTADGTLVAYGSVYFHPTRDEKLVTYLNGAVHPEWRRRGIGSVLLPWELARGKEQLAESGLDLSAEVKVYSEATNTDKIALVEKLGLSIERWFTTMERDMALPVDHRDTAESVAITSYTAEHALGALEARNDAFRDHWGSLPSTEESWRLFVDGEFIRGDLSTLALDSAGRIIAFCLVSINEDDWEARGKTSAYIDLIGVVRDHRGEGLAPLVISRTLEAIKAAELELAILDVDTASPTGANTLYERLGFGATTQEVALVLHV